ncbi:MAG: hypothetical protein ABI024_01590 [Vicinamibacterales bacterium]
MCCTAGWPIPVERSRVHAIEETIARSVIPLRVQPWLLSGADAPDDVAGILAARDNGHCVFFEAGRPGCSIHDVKPAGCNHFPYLCLIDQRGVHVSLSHYCPTAASLLFEHRGPVAIVEGHAPTGDDDVEGMDARESLPPVAADGRTLISFEELSAWEREQVARAKIGELDDADVALFQQARSAVPAPWNWPEPPERLSEIWWSQVATAWVHFDEVLANYAAAKMFASWSLYLGDAVDAAAHSARIASAVLRVEAARQCALFHRPLDRELLIEAIRQSDLLLVHYADPGLIAAASSRGGA